MLFSVRLPPILLQKEKARGSRNAFVFFFLNVHSTTVTNRERGRGQLRSPRRIAMATEGPTGGTLSEIYQNSRRMLLRTRDALERLERLESATTSAGGGLDSPELSTSIKRDIIQIQSSCAEMDRLWRSIGAKSQRDLWRR